MLCNAHPKRTFGRLHKERGSRGQVCDRYTSVTNLPPRPSFFVMIPMSDDQENVSINVWSILMFRSNAPVSNHRSSVQETKPSTRILVIGAGYAGLLFTMRLAGKVASQNVHIALVNESDTFTERPRLHQFATNQEVQWRSLPQMLRRKNIQFIQGRVTSIDLA